MYAKKYPEKTKLNARNAKYKRKARLLNAPQEPVSFEFLKNLYDTEYCTYCNKFTEKNKRTMDHVIPLCKNGSHSESNLVMACKHCNFSKKDKLPTEWKCDECE